MFVKVKKAKLKREILRKTIFGVFLLFILTIPAFGQIAGNTKTAPTQATNQKSEIPIFTEYKGIKIGSTAEEVRGKLGKAKIEDNDGFFYDRDGEMVQIRLDADKKVRLVAITYADKNENAPKFADVFGAEVPIPVQPDGSLYHFVRYPQIGCWVAYSRTAGEKPTVTVTMQKF